MRKSKRSAWLLLKPSTHLSNGFWENPTQSLHRPPTPSVDPQEGPRLSALMSGEDFASPTALQVYCFVQKRFSLAFSWHRIQSPTSRRSRQSIHVEHLQPLPIPLASNYAMPHHHAPTCTFSSITTSTVREELSIVNSILLKSTRAIVPTSLRPSMLSKIHYCHRGAEYCLRFT